jgi:hypothetical protein
MRTIARWIVVVVAVVHGLLHLPGAVEGFGWVDVAALEEPIGPRTGAVWLAAAVLMVATGLLLAVRNRGWWVVGAFAVLVSQAVIITSWPDASTGTWVNLVLVLAVVYGAASQGPTSFRAEYRRRAKAALAEPASPDVVTEEDLSYLPEPVARYLRRTGALGQPVVSNMRVRIHGRIRSGRHRPWMSFSGEQVNTFGADPTRLFFIDATMLGLPVDVLHVFTRHAATMRASVCSLVPTVRAAGPEMDQSETVTLFNDMCLMAPAALVHAPVRWELIDEGRVRAAYTVGNHTVRADLYFNDAGELVDFVSDDRLRASPDGSSFTAQRWSTPVRGYRMFGNHLLGAGGQARWHAPEPEAEFVYAEMEIDRISYNVCLDRRGSRRSMARLP